MFDKLKAIKVRDRGDCATHVVTPQRIAEQYAELCTGEGEELLTEGVSLAELEHVYIGDELAMPYDQYMTTRPDGAMFEAVSSTKAQLIRTMRAFTRKLNMQLSGSGISAGVEDANTAEDDDTAATAGGAEISPVRRVAGVPIVFARIPLSDGQSITIAFHSPTAQTAQLASNDILVAFRFLLNKRDVTHTVAPQGGVDATLVQVTLTIAKLIERNSPKFAKTQARAAQLRDSIATKQSQLEQVSQEQNELVDRGDSLVGTLAQQDSAIVTAQKKLQKQRDINQKLQDELARLQAEPEPEPEPVPEPEPEPQPVQPPAGTTHPGTTRPTEDDPAETKVDYAALFWYGCYQRPYGPGAVPDGVVVALPSQDAKQAPVVAQKDADPSRYTYGVVGYAQPLSQADIDHYNLFDFQNHLTIDEAKEQLQPLILLMRQYKGANPGATSMDFVNVYLKMGAEKFADLPDQYKAGNRGDQVLLTRLMQRYLGQASSGFKNLLDAVWNGITGIEPQPEPQPQPEPVPVNVTPTMNMPSLADLDDDNLENLRTNLHWVENCLRTALADLDKQAALSRALYNFEYFTDTMRNTRHYVIPENYQAALLPFLSTPQGNKQQVRDEIQARQPIIEGVLNDIEAEFTRRRTQPEPEPEPQPEPEPPKTDRTGERTLALVDPATVDDLTACRAYLHIATATKSILERTVQNLEKQTIGKATDQMEESTKYSAIQWRKDSFVDEGAINNAVEFLTPPAGRLKAAIVTELQGRINQAQALIDIWMARLNELKAEFKAGQPARDAERKLVEDAKQGIDDMIEMMFDDESEIVAARQQLAEWAKVLRDRDIDREDDIQMAEYNLDRTMKEFRGEMTPEDTLGEMVETLKYNGVKVTKEDEDKLLNNPALVNDLRDEMNAAVTEWRKGGAAYDTEKETIKAWMEAKLHGEARPNEVTGNAERFMETMRREGVGLNPWVHDMILKYPEALKYAELGAENAYNDLDSFGGDVKAALEAYVDGSVEGNFKEPKPEVSATQVEIETLQEIMRDTTPELAQLREYRRLIRDAHATFEAEGTLSENQDLLNAAINHVADQMAQLARGVR